MLADREIRNVKPREKGYRLRDGDGLYLEVTPSGGKLWRLRYRFGGTEKMLALGKYPEVGAKEARMKSADARQAVHEGRDPSAERKADKDRARISAGNSFEAVARAWMEKIGPTLTDSTKIKHRAFLEGDVFPWIGARPIDDLAAPDLVALLRRIEGRGALGFCEAYLQYRGAHLPLCRRAWPMHPRSIP